MIPRPERTAALDAEGDTTTLVPGNAGRMRYRLPTLIAAAVLTIIFNAIGLS